MVGVAGAWKETAAGIKAAMSAGLEVITNTTLTKDNIETFADTITFGGRLGFKDDGM